MTSLILGIACIYIAFIIVRMPEERFREELDQLSGRKHAPGCYRMIRRLFLRSVFWVPQSSCCAFSEGGNFNAETQSR